MNIGIELKKGILVTAIGKYSNVIVQFIIIAVLSRILSPSEYGIVAIVNVFLVFFTMLVDMGIGPAIIQNKTLNKDNFNEIYSFSVMLSIITSIFFSFLSKPISLFYHNEKLFESFLLMSFALLSSGLNMVPQAILSKRKEFGYLNFIQILSTVFSGIVGILLALNNYSYFSLIISTIIKNLFCFIFFKIKVSVHFSGKIHRSTLSKIYSFSKNQFLFNFINYFSRNLDNILIGKWMSTQTLAFYDKAYTLSLYPNQLLSNVITPVLQPIMSEYEDNKKIIISSYLKITNILATIGFSLSSFMFFSSKEIIYILFGNQWINSVTILQILSVSVGVQMILSSTGAIFQSANRPELLLKSGILSAILNISSIIIGVVTKDINLLAIILVSSFIINFFQAHYLLLKYVLNARQSEFYKILIKPLFIGVLVSTALSCFSLVTLPIVISFILKSIVAVLVFTSCLFVTGQYKVIKKLVLRRSTS
ncbi:lipopolysaccharide biosynthesis protein [Niallia sp. 03190]|uniref:lipopolysaccharide biosynthesis protein n=1 Tax=Niallia sp. 03190 TaxID=3458061 RepID=UPI0040444210